MKSNEQLVKSLIKAGYLKTNIISKAFLAIDRADFVLPEDRERAYLDQALSIGHGQTISQPLTVAFMLEFLKPEPGQKILDIGSGSGWKAALLAQIVSQAEGGLVVTVERLPELKKMAEQNIAKYGFIERGVVKTVLGDGSKGVSQSLVPPEGFDRLIAGAAGDEIPLAWKNQLRLGGRIVAPVQNSVAVLEKLGPKDFKSESYYGFSFVPLIKG